MKARDVAGYLHRRGELVRFEDLAFPSLWPLPSVVQPLFQAEVIAREGAKSRKSYAVC